VRRHHADQRGERRNAGRGIGPNPRMFVV
jgi:hypothetical protein